MSLDDCYVDLSELTLDEAYQKIKSCARAVYRELILTASNRMINKILSQLASKIVSLNPHYNVVEAPRRIYFDSQIANIRYAPFPILAITSPHTAEGSDFPIRYDTIPEVSIEMRRLAVDYVDTMKELIERAKKYRAIITFKAGQEVVKDMELKTDIALTILFDGWSYRMSYDSDYPPVEPPEVYVEGFLYKAGDLEAEGWELNVIEANIIGYKETGGNYYSGYGGVMIIIYNDDELLKLVKVLSRQFNIENYLRYSVTFSNFFTLWAYQPKP